MDFWIYLFLLASFIGASKATRAQTLSCYECAAKPGNNTCTSEFRQTIQSLGFDKRCRIMEMNGRLVSAGIVPAKLCTQAALSKVWTDRKLHKLTKLKDHIFRGIFWKKVLLYARNLSKIGCNNFFIILKSFLQSNSITYSLMHFDVCFSVSPSFHESKYFLKCIVLF